MKMKITITKKSVKMQNEEIEVKESFVKLKQKRLINDLSLHCNYKRK